GLADTTPAAAVTVVGFYMRFGSRPDLMAEPVAGAISQTVAQSTGIDPAQFIDYYLSREHRDNLGTGCPMAALSGDAARQSGPVKATFADGTESLPAALAPDQAAPGGEEWTPARAYTIDRMPRALGSLLPTRSCPADSPLAHAL
ncbi:TetR/AcrR family transcriptional regulator, partial [Pseudomonas syringae]